MRRRLLHVSDIHFGPHFRPEVADGLFDLIDRRRPDLLVISGDLTRRAKRRQFEAARAWVDRLPVPWIAVPGNHDVPMYRVWERLLAPYGMYQRVFDEEMEPIVEDDAMLVVGVNTAFNFTVKDGRFTRAALRRLDRVLAGGAGKAKIVVAHHHLAPPPRFDTNRVTGRAREALEIMAHHEVEMVLSGHLHQTYIATSEEYYPIGSTPVLLVHSGTTTSSRGRGWERRRNSCNWIVIDAETTTIDHLLWRDEAATFEAWRQQRFPRAHRVPWTLPTTDDGLE
ncbi:MAG: metallophosphoesterase family protein [Acidobacteriota bacterium]